MPSSHTSATFLPGAVRQAGAGPTAVQHQCKQALRLVVDTRYGGLGRITGTVKIKGTPDTPVRRPVRLIRDRDSVCVKEVWSDAVTGEYTFEGFDPKQRYTVMTYDVGHNYRAVVADNLTLGVMT